MGFGMFSVQSPPIAIDFGSSSVKLLQIGTGDRPPLLAAAEIPIPDSIRGENDKLIDFYAEWIPKLMREGKFKGKRAVISVPSAQTFTQHMQVAETEGVSADAAVKGQLQLQMGCSPSNVVVRSFEVCPVNRNGQTRTEMICFAIARETVMRHVELLRKCKLEVVGVHTETLAVLRAFEHLCRRAEDANVTTLYVDMGWGGTRVAIAHGNKLTFARTIALGGRHFDQLISTTLNCDITTARTYRLSFQPAAPKTAPQPQPEGMAILNVAMAKAAADKTGAGVALMADRRVGATPRELSQSVPQQDDPPKHMLATVDFTELLDTLTDELSMCLRYHQGLFRGRHIDRTIFVGGESRQSWVCQHIVKKLRLPAQLGDPLARYDASDAPVTPNLKLGESQPGWAVACGLCNAPTDL